MRQYEFAEVGWGLSKQSWLVSRSERERHTKMCRRWRKENPKSTILQELLIEELFALHIYSQRLRDRRILFDGTPAHPLIMGRWQTTK